MKDEFGWDLRGSNEQLGGGVLVSFVVFSEINKESGMDRKCLCDCDK